MQKQIEKYNIPQAIGMTIGMLVNTYFLISLIETDLYDEIGLISCIFIPIGIIIMTYLWVIFWSDNPKVTILRGIVFSILFIVQIISIIASIVVSVFKFILN